MTPAQNTLYWREWGNLTKRCKAEGWIVPDRHELHVRALGKAKSHKDFSNPDFDKVLGVFRAYSQSENVHGQVRLIRQPRTRLEYAIVNERAAMLAALLRVLPLGKLDLGAEHAFQSPADLTLEDHARAERYITELMEQRFGTTDITQISDEVRPRFVEENGKQVPSGWEKSDLECLRDTLDARITALRQKTPWTWHALKMRAGVKCDCKTFCNGGKATTKAPRHEEVAA